MKYGPKAGTKIKTDKLCLYGCGNIAQYISKTNKLQCLEFFNSCPELRRKVSYGVSNSGRDYKEDYLKLPQEIKNKMSLSNKGNYKNIKSILINERNHKCESCGNIEWMGNKIKLELEHIDGNNVNNEKLNLLLLCPNCHSMTKTWRKKKNNFSRKYTDEDIIKVILESTSMNQCLKKLSLSWGSGERIVNCMLQYNLKFTTK